MGAARPIFGVLAALTMAEAWTQTPYPDLTLQDLTWSSGTHNYAVTQKIIAPSAPDLPVEISGSADAEFVSGTEVRLRPGFHAGGFALNEGRFHAFIGEALGQVGDVIIISPEVNGSDAYGGIADNMIHVHKWEKLEVGIRLPQVYQDAIESFFQHYYSNGVSNDATPSQVESAYDLNPYADDSLQLVMTLTDPDGNQRMKWGFFMREAHWDSSDPTAKLTEHTGSILHPYHIRYRISPDMEGLWHFSVAIKAPYTSGSNDQTLPDLNFSGYTFFCEPALPDNRGSLSVSQANGRTLKFQTGSPFIGLGTNMADADHGDLGRNIDPNSWWYSFYKRDHDVMKESMDLLHDAGGNFMRMFLLRHIFAPEWVNLGVYDAYKTPEVCDSNFPTTCETNGWTDGHMGNGQFQSWAFDQMLDQARKSEIYIQLCIDPYMPGVGYEKFLWGAHPFVQNILEPSARPYDLKHFFYQGGNAQNLDEGAFRFWKRKYKYIMARWGYSVNLPIIEPFNEVDQMLTFQAKDLSFPATDPCDEPYRDICPENRVDWVYDPALPGTVSTWYSDIASFVRGQVDSSDPVNSPLGEGDKLFLASYTDAKDATTNALLNGPMELPHYALFTNPDVDLIDVHKAARLKETTSAFDAGKLMRRGAEHSELFWKTYPQPNVLASMRKPFSQGEYQHYTEFEFNGIEHDLVGYFHNYDIAFHNELWSSVFSGKFAAGTTWHWARVFWWPDAMQLPPTDDENPNSAQFSNGLGQLNYIRVNNQNIEIKNKRTHHHFQPLSELLDHPSWLAYGFFDQDFKVRRNEDFSELDVYYLQNSVPPYSMSDVAIGWVQNRNASLYNNYFLHSGRQRFFECTPPSAGEGSTTWLSGFEPGTYHISWFPTRINSTVHPPDAQVYTSVSGSIELDLSGQFGGNFNNFLDTLRADYAFIITPEPFAKSMMAGEDMAEDPLDTRWDFALYPNPTRGEFMMHFQEDTPKEITILDVSGRLISTHASVAGTVVQLPQLRLSQGAYWVRVTNGQHWKAKQLIIY